MTVIAFNLTDVYYNYCVFFDYYSINISSYNIRVFVIVNSKTKAKIFIIRLLQD